jgi:hypothetical protein
VKAVEFQATAARASAFGVGAWSAKGAGGAKTGIINQNN